MDGNVLTEGIVTFLPESGGVGNSPIGADGDYLLVGQDKKEGIEPGTYTAIVMPSMAQIKKGQGDPLVSVKTSDIPPVYTKASTSPLKFTVEAGPNAVDILLEKAPLR